MSESDGLVDERKDLLKRALVRMQRLESEVEALRSRRGEPLAVVGMGCRFPGGADSPARFLELLQAGFDATGEIPSDRWDVETYYDPDPDAVGRMYVRRGGFLAGAVDGFDPSFFGIAPREADELDPQQRLLLEVVWETLEQAGQSPDSLRGTAAGVYVGMAAHDWSRMQGGGGDTSGIGTYYGTGSAHSVAAGRIAYLLGLHGPAITVDTACSSSLVAFHLACQALRSGEIDTAITGGVSLILAPDGHVIASRGRMLSPRGLCATFDASADGYVRGEGCGIVLLRRLSDARAAGDPVLAVVHGTALNQDGRSGGMTAPSGTAQEAVMRAALEASGLRPDDLSYVEAHGTGTELGDPIEVHALAAVHRDRPAERPLRVGSVKTNIGHLEGAAGIAGIIKTVLALRDGTIPPHLHFHTPNPHIQWDAAPLQVGGGEWAPGRRIAGVSSFGFSGTNAHVILEAPNAPVAAAEGTGPGEAQDADAPRDAAPDLPSAPVLVPLSARTPSALRRLASSVADRLSAEPGPGLAAVARTLARGRSHWEERLAVVADDEGALTESLKRFGAGSDVDGEGSATLIHGSANLKKVPRVAFLFTGQGAQRPGMGRELLAAEPVFREAVERCEAVVAPLLGLSIQELLEADPGDEAAAAVLRDTRVTQPALFVLEYALATLWRSWGVEPTVVLGHSVGEYVAACVAGVLDPDDALRLIVERARLMGGLPEGGGMATVFAPADVVRGRLGAWAGRLDLAAENSPSGTVVSGDADALEDFLADLRATGIEGRPLVVSHAFHSHRMDPVLDAFRTAAAGVTHSPLRIDVIANRTGKLAGPDTFNAEYWARHIREPVLFAPSVETLRKEGVTVFVEIGPAPVLLGMAASSPGGAAEVHLPSLRPGHDAVTTIRAALARAWVAGLSPAWSRIHPGPLHPVELPTYPFERERHWFPERRGARPGSQEGHPLLGARFETPRLAGTLWETRLREDTPGWVADHRVFGRPVLPAAALVEMCRAAVADRMGDAFEPADLRILDPLVVEGECLVQTLLDPEAQTLEVVSRDGEGHWRTHLSGGIAAAVPSGDGPRPDGPGDPVDVVAYRSMLGSRGVEYGPSFRGLRRMERGEGWARGDIDPGVLEAGDRGAYGLHPALLDAAFQVCGGCVEESGDIYLPVEVGRISHLAGVMAGAGAGSGNGSGPATPGSIRVHASLRSGGGTSVFVCDVDVGSGDDAWRIEGLRFRKVAPVGSRAERQAGEWLYTWGWVDATLPTATSGAGRWRILAAEAEGRDIARAMEARGRRVEIQALEPVGETANGTDPHASGEDLEGTLVVIPVSDLPGDGPGQGPDVRSAMRPGLTALLRAARENGGGRLCTLTRGAWAVVQDEGVDPAASAAWGLGQTIAVERPDVGCRRIDLSLAASLEESAEMVVDGLLADTAEDRLALRDGQWRAARLRRDGNERTVRPARPAPDYALETVQQGELDGLVLRALEVTPPGPDEVTIRVHATGLNFRDVLNALGMYPGDAGPLGSECVGVVEAVGEGVDHLSPGDRVMAITPRGFCSRVNAVAALVTRCPDGMSDLAAATLPIAFLTADWALGELAGLARGEKVLIHAAAGGVGMAAVQLAHAAGAEVFATAGSERKRAVLRRMGVRHIYNSRSLDFREQILADTGGEGVHVVLNSLADDFIPASLDVLRPDGRFVEIGKTDVWDADRVRQRLPGAAYHVLYLGDACASHPARVRERLLGLVRRFEDGRLHPLPVRTFSLDDAVGAFRYMAQARHIGKVVLHDSTERADDLAQGAVWITGGLGGLGLAAAQDLVERGARRIVLTGRRDPSTGATASLETLRDRGAEVLVLPGDVSVVGEVERLLEAIQDQGWTLRTVIHTAGVVDDAALPRQSWDHFERVLAPKAWGAWYLHRATRDLHLDHFVLYSAGAGWLGSPGQANYAAANAFLDGLVSLRRSEGLPAVSVAWGPWAEVGMAARTGRDWSGTGFGSIDAGAGGAALRSILRSDPGHAAVLPIDWARFPARDEQDRPLPFFSMVAESAAPAALSSASEEDAADEGSDHAARIAALPAPERLPGMESLVLGEVSRVLGLSRSRPPSRDQGLTDLGMDSLMAVELSNRLGRGLGLRLPSTLVFEHATVQELARYLVQQLGIDLSNRPGESTDRRGEAEVADMSDDDLSSALLDELGQIGY